MIELMSHSKKAKAILFRTEEGKLEEDRKKPKNWQKVRDDIRFALSSLIKKAIF